MQIIINLEWIFLSLLLFVLLFILITLLSKPLLRYIIKKISDHTTQLLLTDEYSKNIMELLPSLTRFSIINLLELSLRAQSGKVIKRPLGSPKHFIGYDNLMFNPHQITHLSLSEDTKMDMRVTLGPNAQKPMIIDIPLMIAGMAYGLALSKEAKIALAKASKTLNTVNCSGEGPFLPEEPLESGKFVLQICQWSWGGRTMEQIASADMLEVKMGQGADVGTSSIAAIEFEGRAQVLAGLSPGQPATALLAPPGVQTADDWPVFMKNLRLRANGIPIALKIMATDRIEEELEVAVNLGFDVVVIDGTGGGSHATAPIKQDDFGIPNLLALVRAKQYLQPHHISLVMAGGFFTPGQCLKALALGADALYLGTVPLFALAHGQVEKVLPWEPPTTLIYYDSPTKTQLNIEQAVTSVTNTFLSMVVEMQDAMRALGKSSLKQLSPDDLIALDSFTAKVTGVKEVSSIMKNQTPPEKQENIPPQLTTDQINTLHELKILLHHAHQLVILQEQAITLLRTQEFTNGSNGQY